MKVGTYLAELTGLAVFSSFVLCILCFGLGQLSGSPDYPIPSPVGQVAGIVVATFVAYLSTLSDPAEREQEGERPTGLFVFANAISGLSVSFSAILSSFLKWELSDVIESGILYVCLEQFSKEEWVFPLLVIFLLSFVLLSIRLCVCGARAIRDRRETSFLLRLFSFLLLFTNAILLSDSKNVTALTSEGVGSIDGLLLMSVILISSVTLTVLSSFASALPDIGILRRRPDFQASAFAARMLFTLFTCLVFFLLTLFAIEKIDISGAKYPAFEFLGSEPDFPFLDIRATLKALSIAAMLAICGMYVAFRVLSHMTASSMRLSRTSFTSIAIRLRIASVTAAIVFVSYLPFATKDVAGDAPASITSPLEIGTGTAVPTEPLLVPSLLETHRPDPLPVLDWQDFDVVCSGAVGWKYESIRDVAFPLDECRLSMTNGDVSSVRVILGIVFSSMGTTMRKEQDRAYRRAQTIAQWIDRQLPASIQPREIIILNLGVRKYRHGVANRAEQDDRMERQVIVKGALTDFDDPVPFSYSAKSVRSIVEAAFYAGEFSDCTFYVVDAGQTLLPLKNLNCDEVRMAAE